MRTSVFIGIASILISLGCTEITVKKVAPYIPGTTSVVEGQRISLPRPYIQVTPQPDGSISADIVYLPDPNHTYLITSWSFLANNSLEITTDGGIVKSVNWTGDSSAVLQGAITSAGNAESAVLQADQKKVSDQKTKEETAAKAVSDAQLALDQAQADLAIVLATPNAAVGDVLKARYAVSDATLKLQAATDALGKLRSGSALADQPSTDNKVFGPKLFAIEEQVLKDGTTRMNFVAVKQTNAEWQASAAPQPKYPVVRPVVPTDTNVDFFPKGTKRIHPDKDGKLILLIHASKPVVDIGKTVIKDAQDHTIDVKVTITLESPTLITADLTALKGKPGVYTLAIGGILLTKGGKPIPVPHKVVVDTRP